MTTATPKAAGVPATFGWRLPWMLGLGAFGLAFSITTTAAYLPPLLGRFTDSRTMIAAVLAAEGIFALTLPRRDRALERHVPHAARPAAPVHARRARADGLLPRADGVHAEPLDDDADRARVLLRVLRLRAALPRALPGPAASVGLRALPGHPAPPARARARARARRRRLPLPRLAARAVPDRRVRDHASRAARRSCSSCEDGGHGRVFEGVRAYVRAQLARSSRGEHRRAALAGRPTPPGRERSPPSGRSSSSTSRAASHQPLSTSSAVLGTVAAGYMIAAVVSGPLGDRVGLARVIFVASFVYGGRAARRRLRELVAGLVLRAHLPRRDRGRRGDDARLGPALQADAGGRSGARSRASRPGRRASGSSSAPLIAGAADRRALSVPARHERLPDPLADLRGADPRRDPARLDADARRG